MKPLSLNKPHLIVMVGVPGSGKSFFADHFAQTFSAPIISSARIDTKTQGSLELKTLNILTEFMLMEFLKTTQTLVFDGPSDTRTERQDITKNARAAGYETLFVWVQTESVAAKLRATKQSKDKPYAMTSDEFDYALKRFTPPNSIEKAAVISGKHTYASQLKIVLKRLVDAKEATIKTTPQPPRPSSGRHIMIR
jgi:predicted kinase